LQAVYQWTVQEFDNGRQTSIEWEEVESMVREQMDKEKTI